MVKLKSIPGQGGPSSSLGIMRFFDTESGGPKLTPEFVMVASAIFIVAIIVLHTVF